MSLAADELLAWYDRAQRDLPWRRRGVSAWRAAGFPPAAEPARRPQRYAGTDRQVRGRLLDVLRARAAPVPRADLDVVWLTDTVQRDRALLSLLTDGLVEQTADGRFALAGEGGAHLDPGTGTLD